MYSFVCQRRSSSQIPLASDLASESPKLASEGPKLASEVLVRELLVLVRELLVLFLVLARELLGAGACARPRVVGGWPRLIACPRFVGNPKP